MRHQTASLATLDRVPMVGWVRPAVMNALSAAREGTLQLVHLAALHVAVESTSQSLVPWRMKNPTAFYVTRGGLGEALVQQT